MRVEYRILGPLDVSVDGRAVALGGRHQRALLALLLAHANEVVPLERLIDGLWDEAPPETAANIVQGYVSQLRKLLGRETIVTRGRGYALIADDGALDLQLFEQRAAAGTAAGRPEVAAAELRAALAVWRGPALSDLADLPALRPIAARLDELRLAALERRIGAELECGNAAEAAAELDPLIAEHPLRERLRALQMRALYRCGRQADALAVLPAARETLVDELGLEPGAELQELERAILRRDPSLAPAGGSPPAPAAPTVLCAALATASPAKLADLGAPLAAGRGGELVLAATVASADRARSRDERAARARRRAVAAGRDRPRRRLHVGHPRQRPARLAAEQDVDLLLADAPLGLLEDARLIALLEHAPCDVAVLVGGRRLGAGPVLVPFSGAEHDWAAVELGAWLARSLERPLRLAGASTGASGRDASRLLASASLALQRALGVRAEPVIVEPSAEALVAAAGDAGVVVVGLTERWRHDGLGRARTALATHPAVPTLLVRRGLRPGGLAGRAGDTRFTWTIATAIV